MSSEDFTLLRTDRIGIARARALALVVRRDIDILEQTFLGSPSLRRLSSDLAARRTHFLALQEYKKG
jgi:hypothetical protein